MEIKVIIGSILRHGLSALGAYLVAAGFITPDEVTGLVEVLSGAIIAVGTIGWSVYRTNKLKK